MSRPNRNARKAAQATSGAPITDKTIGLLGAKSADGSAFVLDSTLAPVDVATPSDATAAPTEAENPEWTAGDFAHAERGDDIPAHIRAAFPSSPTALTPIDTAESEKAPAEAAEAAQPQIASADTDLDAADGARPKAVLSVDANGAIAGFTVSSDGVVFEGDVRIDSLQYGAVTPVEEATANEEAEAPMRWLKMKVSMSGTEFSLSRGWKHRFCDKPGPNGEASEAQRLVDAGFAIDTDAPKV